LAAQKPFAWRLNSALTRYMEFIHRRQSHLAGFNGIRSIDMGPVAGWDKAIWR